MSFASFHSAEFTYWATDIITTRGAGISFTITRQTRSHGSTPPPSLSHSLAIAPLWVEDAPLPLDFGLDT